MLAEARVRGLVEHKVGRLNVDKICEEGCEEKRKHHSHDQGKVEQDLRSCSARVHNKGQEASGAHRCQKIIGDHHIDVTEGHHDNENEVEVLQDNE